MEKLRIFLTKQVTPRSLLIVGLVLSLVVYNLFFERSRQLQNRSDYPQIVAACVSLTRGITNGYKLFNPGDPRVPALLNSLSPRYISASSNYVTLEFAGGFDHYGYRVRQSATNSKQWTISYYTEQGAKLLATITDD